MRWASPSLRISISEESVSKGGSYIVSASVSKLCDPIGVRQGCMPARCDSGSSYTEPKANVSRIGKGEPTWMLCWCFFSLPDSKSASSMAAGAGLYYVCMYECLYLPGYAVFACVIACSILWSMSAVHVSVYRC